MPITTKTSAVWTQAKGRVLEKNKEASWWFQPWKIWVKLYIPFKTPIVFRDENLPTYLSCHLGIEKRFKIHALHRAWGLAASYPKDLSPSWAIFTRTPCPCGPCKGKEGSIMKLLWHTGKFFNTDWEMIKLQVEYQKTPQSDSHQSLFNDFGTASSLCWVRKVLKTNLTLLKRIC